MASLGFTAVLDYSGTVAFASGAQSLGTEIDTARADGLAFIVSVKDIVPSLQSGEQHPYSYYAGAPGAYPLTTTCVNPSTGAQCANDDDYIEYIASLAKSHAGTWGYYVADEPQTGPANGSAGWDGCTGDVPAIDNIIADIRTQDAIHPVMIVLGWWYSQSQADMTAQAGCFTDSAKKIVIGIDYYPWATGGIYSSEYVDWLANAVTADAADGVIGGVYIGQAESNDPGNPSATWAGLSDMTRQKQDFMAAHVPNGIYGLYDYPDIISTPNPNGDNTPVATKRADVMQVLKP
jgi:hypothetical protein